MITWLIGLSGSGKTTIGTLLQNKIIENGKEIVLLDGDVIRGVWGDNLGSDIESRRKNAVRISKLCQFLDEQGVNVLACVLSIFPEWQAWNRDNFKEYYQVYLDVPISVVQERDTKGLYTKINMGKITNVVGVDIEFPVPINSDLTLTMKDLSFPPDNAVNIIYNEIVNRM